MTESPTESHEADADAGLRYAPVETLTIRRVKRGKGFRYETASGASVSDEAALKRIRSLPIPPAWTDVGICPIASGHIQAVGADTQSCRQYRYHPRWMSGGILKRLRTAASFAIVAAFVASQQGVAQRGSTGVAIMIHGAGGGGWEWDKWKPVFEAAGWRVVAPDLVPVRAGIAATRFGDYVRQVTNWCAKHKGKPIALVGASMGGVLALKAAEVVRPFAVVLVNSAMPSGIRPATENAVPYPTVIEWSKGTLKETRDAMPDSDEATIQKAFKRWRDESGGVLTELRAGITVKRPICPVLVLLGAKDTDIPPEHGRSLARLYDADVIEYAKMSHVGPLLGTRASEVARTVLQWLGAHKSAGYSQPAPKLRIAIVRSASSTVPERSASVCPFNPPDVP